MAAVRAYQRAISRWPVDIVRPEVSFSKAIQRRVERRFGTPPVQASGLEANRSGVKFSLEGIDTNAELGQANALFSLLENRYARKYPLSQRILSPKSNPMYYKNLVQELKDAPQRSWFSRLLNRWKGFLRFT